LRSKNLSIFAGVFAFEDHFILKIKTTGFNDIEKAWADFPKKADRIIAGALNKSGNKGRTQVIKAAAKETGIKQKSIRKVIKTKSAFYKNLEYELKGTGSRVSYKDMGAKKIKVGVSVSRGQIKLKHNTFLGGYKLGGHVYQRTGRYKTNSRGQKVERLKKLMGPSVPDVLARENIQDNFFEISQEEMPKQIISQLSRFAANKK